jgi:exopolysaccharide biosynthesis polyprenyl glycosylphosphotransferase
MPAVRLFTDAAVVTIALVGASLAAGVQPSFWEAVFGVAAVGTMAARGAYARRMEDSLVVVLARHVLASAVIATMITVTGRALVENELTSARSLVVVFLVATAALATTRVLGTVADRQRYTRGTNTSRAVIVGSGEVAARAAHRLRRRPDIGLMPIGYLDDTRVRGTAPTHPDIRRLPMLGTTHDFADVIANHDIDALVITYLDGAGADTHLSAVVTEAHEQRITVFVVPRLFEVVNSRTRRHRLGTLPVDQLRPVDPRSRQFQLKYTIDRVIGALAIVVLAPAMLTIATAVKLSSPGPILYRQRRVGLDGEEFDILKFRSMREAPVASAAPPTWAPDSGLAPGGVEGEDRRTRVGRFLRSSNLDELPQLINIARGDMCIVGPRPERPEFVERFSREFKTYDARHRVKAGLTGWSQVHGFRGKTSIADRAEWDNYYIENWSFALDMAIVVRTIKTFFQDNE